MPVPAGAVEFAGVGTSVTRGMMMLNSPVMDTAVGTRLSLEVAFKIGDGAVTSMTVGVAAGISSGVVEKMSRRVVALMEVVKSPMGMMDMTSSLDDGTAVVETISEEAVSEETVSDGPGGRMYGADEFASIVELSASRAEVTAAATELNASGVGIGVTVTVTVVGPSSSSLCSLGPNKRANKSLMSSQAVR